MGALIVLFATAQIATARATMPLAELVSAVLISYAVGSSGEGVAKILRHPAAQFIGVRSYAIYLWHYPAVFAIRDSLGFAATATIGLVFSIAMAELSYRTVEAWGRQLKSRPISPQTLSAPPAESLTS